MRELHQEPATERQLDLITSLVKERRLKEPFNEHQIAWLQAGDYSRLDKWRASTIISTLLEAPKKTTSVAEYNRNWPNVPTGRYALVWNEVSQGRVVKFYKINRPTEGKWAGYIFVDAQASDEFYPVKNKDSKADIMNRIAADPKAAAELYGKELGSCGICGRTLTDETSRAIGIGPVCRDRSEWYG